MRVRDAIVVLGIILFSSAAAFAAKNVMYENQGLGLKFSWIDGSEVKSLTDTADVILDGVNGAIKLKVVVRKGEQVPAAHHRYRLISYLPGEWEKAEEECRGTGWSTCESWTWDAESGKERGIAQVGYGPGGTYIFVLSSKKSDFKAHRPAMRKIQESIQLF